MTFPIIFPNTLCLISMYEHKTLLCSIQTGGYLLCNFVPWFQFVLFLPKCFSHIRWRTYFLLLKIDSIFSNIYNIPKSQHNNVNKPANLVNSWSIQQCWCLLCGFTNSQTPCAHIDSFHCTSVCLCVFGTRRQMRKTCCRGQKSRHHECSLFLCPLKHQGTSNYLLFSRD